MISELPLVGAGGEPVDLKRTLASHGVASLPPSTIDEEAWTLDVTLPSGRGARTVRVSEGRAGVAHVEGATSSIVGQLRHMFRLDEDLSPFYTVGVTIHNSRGRPPAQGGCCAVRPCSRTS